MKCLKLLVPVFFFAGLANQIYAQGDVSIHVGPSIPMSDFADKDEGGAAIGFNAGLQLLFPLSESGLGLFTGADFSYNSLKSDVKDELEKMFDDNGINASIDYSKFINIPLLFGLQYDYTVDNKVALIIRTGLALNFLKVTNMDVSANGETVSTKFDWANNVGLKFGGGVLINQKVSVSLDYFGLGEHDVTAVAKSEMTGETVNNTMPLKIDYLTLTLGFRM